MTASNSLPITLRLTSWGKALTNTLLKDRRIYKEIDFTEEDRKIIASTFYEDKNPNWCHFATKHYTEEQIDFQKVR